MDLEKYEICLLRNVIAESLDTVSRKIARYQRFCASDDITEYYSRLTSLQAREMALRAVDEKLIVYYGANLDFRE